MSLLPLLLLIPWIGSGPETHPDSFSNLTFHVEDDGLRLEWWIQSRTLMEETELGFDCEDIWLATPLEAEAAWPAIQTYLEEGFTIRVDGELWQPRFEEYSLEENGFTFKVASRFESQGRPAKLELRVDHFFDGANPEHFVAVDMHGMSEDVDRWILMWGKREATFPVPAPTPVPGQDADSVRAPSIFWEYFAIGRDHVLGGLDHLAFLLALLFGVAHFKGLIAAITGFTVSHSITLGLGAFELLSLPRNWVEPGISFSISAALWWHLWRGNERSQAWRLAFLFGLLHGSSFASSLRQLAQGDVVSKLLAFNLGVEFGQLIFIVPLVMAGVTLTRMLRSAEAREQARHYAALLLGGFALVLFGKSVHLYTNFRLDQAPESLAALPGALALAMILALVMARRTDPQGRPLLPQVLGAAALAGLYSIGNWLGS